MVMSIERNELTLARGILDKMVGEKSPIEEMILQLAGQVFEQAIEDESDNATRNKISAMRALGEVLTAVDNRQFRRQNLAISIARVYEIANKPSAATQVNILNGANPNSSVEVLNSLFGPGAPKALPPSERT